MEKSVRRGKGRYQPGRRDGREQSQGEGRKTVEGSDREIEVNTAEGRRRKSEGKKGYQFRRRKEKKVKAKKGKTRAGQGKTAPRDSEEEILEEKTMKNTR